MAIIEKKYEVGIRHINSSNLINNYGTLSLLEDIACYHSDIAGYGIKQLPYNHLSWVILHWKVSVFKRVCYGTTVTVKTWSRNTSNAFTLRDFEIYDENDNLICIASSKWAMINIDTKKIVKLTDDIFASYTPENRSVFNEDDIIKLQEPEVLESPIYTFKVQKSDIDFNEHMHNLNYLSYAYNALPQDFLVDEPNYFEIMYKSSSHLNDHVSCYYSKQDNNHFIIMKTEDKLHAIVKL